MIELVKTKKILQNKVSLAIMLVSIYLGRAWREINREN